MKCLKLILAVLLCFAMVLPFASCSSADTSWVLKDGENTITAGHYLYYLTDAYSSAIGRLGENATGSLWAQSIEDKPAYNWIEDIALETASRYLAIEKMFADENLTLSADEVSTAQFYANFYWTYYGGFYEKNGVSLETVSKAATNDIKATALFQHIYGEGGEKEIAKEEIEAELTENYAKIRAMTFSLTDATGAALSESKKEELLKLAERYNERIQNGENIDDLADEYAASIAPANSSDKTDEETDEEKDPNRNAAIINKDDTNVLEALRTEAFKLEIGETTLVTDKTYIRLIQRFDILEDDFAFEAEADTIRVDMKGDEFRETLNTVAAGMTIEKNADALEKYNPKKIKM